LLSEMSENTVVVSSVRGPWSGDGDDTCESGLGVDEDHVDVLIAIPKREQTPDEMDRTRHFSGEVVELLGHARNYTLNFNKFFAAYHHHFGRQCRVSEYGFTKLIELFEAIPETVDITEDMDGERLLQLTEAERLKVVGEQIVDLLIKSGRKKAIPLKTLSEAYTRQFGFQLRLDMFGVENVEDLLDQLQSWVRIIDGKETMVAVVDKDKVTENNPQLEEKVLHNKDEEKSEN